MNHNNAPMPADVIEATARPFQLDLRGPFASASGFNGHIQRRLSAMQGQFLDEQSYSRLLPDDPVMYEVYEVRRPEVAGELPHGISIVHPGCVGDEFFMTKGHFHSLRATSEIYYCLRGRGFLLMETEEGAWAAEDLYPGCAVYVPPNWAHRSINVSKDEDLVTFFAYPGNAGHDYATIERRGFRKLIVSQNGGAGIVDNPRWIECPNGR